MAFIAASQAVFDLGGTSESELLIVFGSGMAGPNMMGGRSIVVLVYPLRPEISILLETNPANSACNQQRRVLIGSTSIRHK
jgi:hypothetical protein